MDRNHDVLYEIILSLIARPTPKGLYNLIAANPAAWMIFQCYPRPLLRRVASLERAILGLLSDACATSDRSIQAASTAVNEAQAAGGTHEEAELVTKARALQEAAIQQGKEVREALRATEPLLLGKAMSVKGVDGNPVVDAEYRELCRQLAEWRRFRTKFMDSVATAASMTGRASEDSMQGWEAVCGRVRKIVRKHGPEEFLKRWRRALCGLGIGERRSTRVTQMRMRKISGRSS
ncbi:hypothetical protein FN846DRAFT_971927 [Sphaerosporella brunnea]|uniref:Uncharacterized protein n=1 Tax=Sphaerosporella brunnea TaxID=1250544 RepID=A0A5J5EIL5_9PEZI|nr:hypothetical protein FN846DRAFT_971927 [Sphaerosporella brunnea]